MLFAALLVPCMTLPAIAAAVLPAKTRLEVVRAIE
jgi:hypothetical protein